MTEITPAQQAAIEAQLNAPAFAQGYRQAKAQMAQAQGQSKAAPGAILQQFLKSTGVQIPHDYEIQQNPDGSLKLGKTGWFFRNSDWLMPAALGGAAGITALTGAAGGTTAGATAATTTLPSSQIGNGFIPAITGGTGLGLDATTAATTGADAVTDVATDAAKKKKLSDAIKKIALAGIPIGTALGTKAATGGFSGPEAGQNSPELQQLLAMALKRMSDQQPLQDAVNRQAYAGLPTYAKQGGQ